MRRKQFTAADAIIKSMQNLLAEQMLVLFAILAIGSWLGQFSWRGMSLGTAGVLFTAMVFGHFGLSVPREVQDLGLLLFVYAVGISAGPRFFRAFRRHGIRYVLIALVTVTAGALATVGVALLFNLPADLAAGLYTGALTCTPGLAAAVDIAERALPGAGATISVGYGVAYPFSMISVVLLVQFLPRLLRRNLRHEEAAWLAERSIETPDLQVKTFRLTNPNCAGKRVAQINPHRMARANISRVKRGEAVFAAGPDVKLELGDVVMVVGPVEELEKLQLLLGEETHERMDVNTTVLSMDVEVAEESLTGKTLASMRLWEQYTLVITRIRRQGLEIAPTGNATLEMGDQIRVVGDRDAVEVFVKLVHGAPRRAEETSMVPFLIGLVLGIAVGSIPVNLPNGITIKLGMAGGAFIVSLLVGHFGKIGPFHMYVPAAAKNLSRELGLMLFLAGAGTNAGSHFVEVLQTEGWQLLLAGALVTIISLVVGLLLMNRIYRLNLLATMGALCATMTNPPGLGAANAQTETDLPSLSYASVYPTALIFKILLAQILVEVLRWVMAR
jgi:putative transport protein